MLNNNLLVYCLKYAESVLSESMAFDGGSKDKQIPISFAVYLIRTKDKNILVDTGCNTMPGFEMKRYFSPIFVLRQMGFSSKDITDIIITHSHHDHIEAVKYFENAVIHISKSEYENAKKYIPNDFKVLIFEKEYDVTPQIKILECGGHAKGSSIVEIKTYDNIHILAGDECYTNENIKNKICTGSFFDKEKLMEFIEKYSNENYRVHTCHDISLKTERII